MQGPALHMKAPAAWAAAGRSSSEAAKRCAGGAGLDGTGVPQAIIRRIVRNHRRCCCRVNDSARTAHAHAGARSLSIEASGYFLCVSYLNAPAEPVGYIVRGPKHDDRAFFFDPLHAIQ